MQELNELPKAQKIFKEYVNNQMQELISQSQNLATKYLNERENLRSKEQTQLSARRKVQQMVKLLGSMLKIPMNLRQDIPQLQGLKDEQLQLMKEKYELLLDSYPPQQCQQQKQGQDMLPNLSQNLDISLNSLTSLQIQGSPLTNSSILSRSIVSPALKFLEGVTYLCVVMIIVYRLLF